MQGVNVKHKYTNITVAKCAQMCTDVDTFACRSFDFKITNGMCYLYDANIADGVLNARLKLVSNKEWVHYSRNFSVFLIVRFNVIIA